MNISDSAWEGHKMSLNYVVWPYITSGGGGGGGLGDGRDMWQWHCIVVESTEGAKQMTFRLKITCSTLKGG